MIVNEGGPMGYGLITLPFSIPINLLLITAGLTFKKKFNKSIGLLIINSIGLIWSLLWLFLLVTTPVLD